MGAQRPILTKKLAHFMLWVHRDIQRRALTHRTLTCGYRCNMRCGKATTIFVTGEVIGRPALHTSHAMQGVQLSGVPRLQGICQRGYRCCTGPSVILLANWQDNEVTTFQFIHSVAKQSCSNLHKYFRCCCQDSFDFYVLYSLISMYCKFWTIKLKRTYKLHAMNLDKKEKSCEPFMSLQRLYLQWWVIDIVLTWRYVAKQIAILFTYFWIITMFREYCTHFILHCAWCWMHFSMVFLNYTPLNTSFLDSPTAFCCWYNLIKSAHKLDTYIL